jgi:hypothetical protein
VSRSSGTFQNVLEAFDATQRKGRAGRRLTICFSYRQREHSGKIGENTDRDDGNREKSGDLGATLGGEAGVRPSKLGRTGGGLSYDNGGDGNGGTGGTGSRSSGDYRKESAGRDRRKRRGGSSNQDESPDKRSGSGDRNSEENRREERRHQTTPARTRLEDRGGKKEDLRSAEENHGGYQQGDDGKAGLSTGRPASGPRGAGGNPGGGKRHAYGGCPGKRGACVTGETATDGGHSRERHEGTVSKEAGPSLGGSGQGSQRERGHSHRRSSGKPSERRRARRKTREVRPRGRSTRGAQPRGRSTRAPTKGAKPQVGAARVHRPKGRSLRGLDQWGAVPRGPEDDLRAEAESPRGGSPRDRRRGRLGVRVEECPPTGGHQSDRGSGGPDEHSEGRVCGPCLQDQRTEGEAGAGTAQEGGSDGEGHPKEEPHIDPDRAGGALEHRRGGGGRPPKERLTAQRTAAGRVPEKLRVPHQEVVPKRESAEHGLRRGTQNPPRGNGERKGRCRYDPLLRDGGDPGEEVFQVPSFRPHSEGVQEQGAVLQVRERGPPEERLHGGGQEVPELRQDQEGVNEPLRDGQEVPRIPEDDAAEGEQNREDLNGIGEYSYNTRDNLLVFQVNLGRGREATDLLQKTAEEQNADVVLIQESVTCLLLHRQDCYVGQDRTAVDRVDAIHKTHHQIIFICYCSLFHTFRFSATFYARDRRAVS